MAEFINNTFPLAVSVSLFILLHPGTSSLTPAHRRSAQSDLSYALKMPEDQRLEI